MYVEKENFFLLSERFCCKDCNKTFTISSPEVIKHMPAQVQNLFPAFTTSRGAVSKGLLGVLTDMAAENVNFSRTRRLLKQRRSRRVMEIGNEYYSSLSHIAAFTASADDDIKDQRRCHINWPRWPTASKLRKRAAMFTPSDR